MIALQTWIAVKEDELDMILLDYVFPRTRKAKFRGITLILCSPDVVFNGTKDILLSGFKGME